jgi:glycosyltransferase involved in cell wall biosynthesis
MKIIWLIPADERCGIATYSRRYVAELSRRAEIVCLDFDRYTVNRSSFITELNTGDCVHIQYEPSFFFHNRCDWYADLCRAIRVPVVSSLHEVYHSFPDVYPREAIRGNGLLAMVRRKLYDRRHPLQTAYRRHVGRSFFSSAVLVHYEYQKSIIVKQGCSPEKVSVIPLPVPVIADAALPGPFRSDRPLSLASTGFINPHFDYDLLIAVLERLTMPWRFTWIGGSKHDDTKPLHSMIIAKVKERGWTDRFTVTGWISEKELRARLQETDVVCAFFTARSSSASLTEALGSLRPLIATPLPLTEELARKGVLHLVPADPDRLARGIKELAVHSTLRSTIITKVNEYCRENNYPALSNRLLDLYRDLLRADGRRDR